MIRFQLHRDEDLSNVSGIGIVAEGVVFGDGTAVMHWLGDLASTAIYLNLQTLSQIHCHGGTSRIVLLDHTYDRDFP